jgi:L-lactate utilization protein LutC
MLKKKTKKKIIFIQIKNKNMPKHTTPTTLKEVKKELSDCKKNLEKKMSTRALKNALKERKEEEKKKPKKKHKPNSFMKAHMDAIKDKKQVFHHTNAEGKKIKYKRVPLSQDKRGIIYRKVE